MKKNYCTGCMANFGSLTAFQDHRLGTFSDPSDPRRCMTADALSAKGWTRAPESVKVYHDGKPTREWLDTWHMPVSDADRERLARLRQSDEDEDEAIEEAATF